MINISKSSIDDLEYLGSGVFGSVYKKDNETAYKIYHDEIVERNSGRYLDNPILTVPKVHFDTLINRGKKLSYSGCIRDLISVDNKFKGVVIPYYEGDKLSNLMRTPMEKRIEYAKRMVKSSKELNDNWIYPTDYKLNNVIVSNDKAYLIDLDDVRTHAFLVPSALFRAFSTSAMAETVQTLLGQCDYLGVTQEVRKEIGRDKWIDFPTYRKIQNYINRKEKEKKIIFIDDSTDIVKLIENVKLDDKDIVYVIESDTIPKEKYKSKVDKLKVFNVPLYDFVLRNKIDDYKYVELIGEAFSYSDNTLKRVYKK